MAAELPIPLEFRLPEGWYSAPPDELGSPDAAFVAVHPATRGDFTAYITLSGEVREDQATLREVADEGLDTLQQFSEFAELSKEVDTGNEKAPGLTRLIEMRAVLEGKTLDLMQCQIFLRLQDVEDANKHAVLKMMLTATPEQLRQLAVDFEEFVGSVEPARAGQ